MSNNSSQILDETEFDVIVLGTGLIESIVAGLVLLFDFVIGKDKKEKKKSGATPIINQYPYYL